MTSYLGLPLSRLSREELISIIEWLQSQLDGINKVLAAPKVVKKD